MKQNTICCPICNGTGKVDKPTGLKIKERQQAIAAHIKTLQEDGYSLRDIAKMRGFKSVSTVSYYLNFTKINLEY